MTNLTNLSAGLKKSMTPFILAVLIATLTALIYFRYMKKSEESIPQIPFPSFPALKQKIHNFQTGNLKIDKDQPDSVYTFDTSMSVDNTTATQHLLNISKIKSEPISTKDINLGEGKLYSSNEGFVLSYEKAVVYQKTMSQQQFKPLPQNIESLKNSARDILTTIIDGSFINLEPKIIYLKFTGEDITEVPKDDAHFIKFHFGYKVEGISVISNSPPISVTLDTDATLITIDLLLLPQPTQKTLYPVISAKEAVNSLEKGNGTLVRLDSEREDAITATTLGVVDLRRGYLAYYLNKRESSLNPVWVFEGKGEIFNKEASALLVVPAIDPRYLFKPIQP